MDFKVIAFILNFILSRYMYWKRRELNCFQTTTSVWLGEISVCLPISLNNYLNFSVKEVSNLHSFVLKSLFFSTLFIKKYVW